MARLARIPWLLAPAAIVALAVWLDGTEMVFEDSETVNLNETGDSRTGDGTSTVRCVDGDLDSIQIALADGQDELLIESTGDNPITSASLGPGNDLIVLGTSSVPIYLNQITRAVTLDGGGGTDSLTLRDTGDSSDDIITVTATAVGAGTFDTFFGGNGSATHSNAETIAINAGAGDSNIGVLGTAASASTTIDAGPGPLATSTASWVPSRFAVEAAATSC